MLVFLLTLVDEKDQKMIRKLYARYNGFMLRTARRVLEYYDHKNFALDCEDAVQNAYMKIIRYGKPDMNRSDKEIRAYLYTVVVNECYLILEDHKKRQELDVLSVIPNDEDFIESINIAEEYENVVRAISRLEPIYSTTLHLCLVEEIKPAEVAKMLDVSINTVNTRLRRGKQQLLEALKEK